MPQKVAELQTLLAPDTLASGIIDIWTRWNTQKDVKRADWSELRNYLFATDTSSTSNKTTGWRNKTTIPKLTQIRDNLFSNYIATLFPNDNWMRWEGYSAAADTEEKRQVIQGYMSNKVRTGGFIEVAQRAVYDYIDYGNAFVDVEYVNEFHKDPLTGEDIQGYRGPRLRRISPLDIVFDPTVPFADSPKLERSKHSFGDFLARIEEMPEDSGWLTDAVTILKDKRMRAGSYDQGDFEKVDAYQVDGFGNLQEYYKSDTVELIEFEGTLYDPSTQEVLKNYIITVADRSTVVRKEALPAWHGRSTKSHVGWRTRPDNTWAMGPLDNLVGMQYRIDHLENLKADAWDMTAFPMVKIVGEVEDFNFGPGEEVQVIDGDVGFMSPDPMFLQADTQISVLEQKMEEFAGAPREALGIRSPGEKTAFEVSTLSNASSRVFQEKTTAIEFMFEDALGNMLESARRNLDTKDMIRVVDEDLGVDEFINVTKEDITAEGKLRPVGARHFAAQQRLLQDINNLLSGPLGGKVDPHMSGKSLSALVNDVLQLEKYDVVSDNVAIFEELETQRLVNQGQEDLAVEQSIGTEGPPVA